MSYREENGQVTLTMSREDYDGMLILLGAACDEVPSAMCYLHSRRRPCSECELNKEADNFLESQGLRCDAVAENAMIKLTGDPDYFQLDKRIWLVLYKTARELVSAKHATEALSQELHSIDEALARRPALADLNYRYEKVYRACEMAGKTEVLGEEVYLCKKQFAEFCERNAGDITELRTQSSNLLTQVEALSGQLQGDLN